MVVKDIYEIISETKMCSEGKLYVAIDAAVRVLKARYNPQYVETAPYRKPDSLEVDLPIYPEYDAALVQYVIYQITGDAERHAEFMALADEAYQRVWSKKRRNARILNGGI